MTLCPECDVKLRPGAKSCKCGWTESKSAKAKPPVYATCAKCGNEYVWPRLKEPKPEKRIIGLTRSGGHICVRCYEKGEEFDWRSKAHNDFFERHQNDMWGALIRASYTLKNAPKEEWVEFMGLLKAQARKTGGAFGGLPYDPRDRLSEPEYRNPEEDERRGTVHADEEEFA